MELIPGFEPGNFSLKRGGSAHATKKSPSPSICEGDFDGADSQIRTGDLILTKDALYLLSYISIGNE